MGMQASLDAIDSINKAQQAAVLLTSLLRILIRCAGFAQVLKQHKKCKFQDGTLQIQRGCH